MLGMHPISPEKVQKKSWGEFQRTGLFLLINSILHVFGWAIMYEIEAGEISAVYPVRVKYRGFSENAQASAHKMIAQYMVENAELLKDETEL